MRKGLLSTYKNEPALVVAIIIMLFVSVIMLRSLASGLFPQYFIYITIAVAAFLFFSRVDFELLTLFSRHFYVLSIALLIFTFLVGQATRGVIRWIQIGPYSFQPTEIVRPFLIIFFATYLNSIKIKAKTMPKIAVLVGLPLFLILIQPSLGVATLTFFAILGVFLSLDYDKRKLILAALGIVISAPVAWIFLAPYQKGRILGLIAPGTDPTGTGYNRIQSIIAVGSGKLSGRGLGEGIQTQLAFLPEKYTDFIFASIAEEFGLIGTVIIMLIIFFIFYRVIILIEKAKTPIARSFVSGVLLSMLVQVFVHIGMNMGIAPITGIPLPLVSAGGSSLIATMATLGMVINTKRHPKAP